MVKNPPANARYARESLIPGSRRSPGEERATYPNILAWEIPWTEEPRELQSMGSQSDMTAIEHKYTHIIFSGQGQNCS